MWKKNKKFVLSKEQEKELETVKSAIAHSLYEMLNKPTAEIEKETTLINDEKKETTYRISFSTARDNMTLTEDEYTALKEEIFATICPAELVHLIAISHNGGNSMLKDIQKFRASEAGSALKNFGDFIHKEMGA